MLVLERTVCKNHFKILTLGKNVDTVIACTKRYKSLIRDNMDLNTLRDEKMYE